MNAGELHRLARVLREAATVATANPGEPRVSAGVLAIAEDIAEHGASSIGQIAARTGMAQSVVSKTVAALRDAGVLLTRTDPTDRRRLVVSIDPRAGADRFRSRGRRPIGSAIQQLRPAASPSDVRRIVELLDELARRLGLGERGERARRR